jgi:hypothetical protein
MGEGAIDVMLDFGISILRRDARDVFAMLMGAKIQIVTAIQVNVFAKQEWKG